MTPSSSTSLKTSENVSAHGAPVLIQRLDKEWNRDLLHFCHQYHDDMPDKSHITHEVDNWESTWLRCPEKDVPTNISETLKATNPVSFPNISMILRLLAVLPVTSCTCERSASSIRLLKTYLRSTMTQERLNGLATLFTQKDIHADVGVIIDRFGMKHKRRLAMTNILDTEKTYSDHDESLVSEVYSRFIILFTST